MKVSGRRPPKNSTFVRSDRQCRDRQDAGARGGGRAALASAGRAGGLGDRTHHVPPASVASVSGTVQLVASLAIIAIGASAVLDHRLTLGALVGANMLTDASAATDAPARGGVASIAVGGGRLRPYRRLMRGGRAGECRLPRPASRPARSCSIASSIASTTRHRRSCKVST